MTATSLKRSQPTILRRRPVAILELDEEPVGTADVRLPAASATFVTTCALVRIVPSPSTTKPEPCAWPSEPKLA